ncbi:ornithine cyclodeaminase family protein [Clavibacter californiensis]|uniref:Ornithine cyclodeaminase family protein n=1 Tax=Clavibacter californiensis TaxID=1401995 RepID=A0ABX9N7P9_9MICO|nr:ornithine cyclodeaminase family protein [Clavibacter californiensis]PPF55678.1 ornithine cyclodeaminase [Clavibacter michiganensis]RII93631.1 ornithine cyclodeaminase family protein [Clavibacter californiensis]UKF80646.1 ornithine cyclodeaminase family protein [Clavibacter californiensis]
MPLALSYDAIGPLLEDVDVLGVVERIFADLGSGAMEQPAPVALSGTDDGLILPMAARSDRLGLAAVKLMADLPGNAALGLPTQRSTILVSSLATGECVAVLDGALITRLRTAASSALATRLLARPESRVLGLIGAGPLAEEHVRAVCAATGLEEVVVWSRSAATVARFREGVDVPVAVAPDPRAVVEACDVLCTLTPSVNPLVRGAWLRPGMHVNAVGARPRPTHRELDAAAMTRGTLVVDGAETARAKSGDLLRAIAEGALDASADLRELGAVVVGAAPGRIRRDEITVFDSVGLGAQDLAVAAAVIDLARARGVGDDLRLAAGAVAAVGA